MSTKTTASKSNGNGLKATIKNRTTDYSDQAKELISQFIDQCSDANKVKAETLLLGFFGGDAWKLSDEIERMKNSFLELLVLLSDTKLSEKFTYRENGCPLIAVFARRILEFLNNADNRVLFAEINRAEISLEGIDQIAFELLKNKLSGENPFSF